MILSQMLDPIFIKLWKIGSKIEKNGRISEQVMAAKEYYYLLITVQMAMIIAEDHKFQSKKWL